MGKAISWVVVGVMLVVGQAAFADTQAAVTNAERIRAVLEDAASDQVLVVAHRAAWKRAPENSVAAVQDAIDMGVDVIEIDIRKTQDGAFVLMHDDTVNRTTNGKGAVHALTLAQIKELRLRGRGGVLTDERVPTLQEIVELCRGKVMLNLDKAQRYLGELIPLLKRESFSRQVILKGRLSPEQEAELFAEDDDTIFMPIFGVPKRRDGGDVQSLQTAEALYPMSQRVRMVELIFSNVDDPAVSHEVLGQIRERGVRAWVNTLRVCHPKGHVDGAAVKDPDRVWGALIGQGFSAIQTDEPEVLLAYLRGKGLHW